jgi:DNA-binding GntR family transcriptional regulator
VRDASGSGEGLDRTSVVPLYFQLQELLKEKIELGAWPPGSPIPPEMELCATYDVSRTVVRQALAILEQDGQIERHRGRGTFVSPPKIERRAGGLTRLLATRGPEAEIDVLNAREQDPPRRIADQLQLGPDDRILRLMSLLRIRGAPVALYDSFIPLADADPVQRMLPHEIPGRLSARRALTGVDLGRTSVAIETSFCSRWEGEQLGIGFHGAVFVTLVTEYVREGERERPFEVARAVYRVDRVQFRLEVSEHGTAPEATWQLADAARAR